MTDRARLTVERVEQIREYALAGKVDTILVQEQECVALCDHALAALRRESAATDGGVSGEHWPECEEFYDLMQRYRHVNQHACHPNGEGETVAAYEEVKSWLRMALRSLERPACRVVPDGRFMEFLGVVLRDNGFSNHDVAIIRGELSAMLAASPPAATEGWVKKNQLASDIDDANKE